MTTIHGALIAPITPPRVRRGAVHEHAGVGEYPEWSSRGIAFTVYTGGEDRQLYRMNADGTGVTQLTRGGTPSFQPAWKP